MADEDSRVPPVAFGDHRQSRTPTWTWNNAVSPVTPRLGEADLHEVCVDWRSSCGLDRQEPEEQCVPRQEPGNEKCSSRQSRWLVTRTSPSDARAVSPRRFPVSPRRFPVSPRRFPVSPRRFPCRFPVSPRRFPLLAELSRGSNCQRSYGSFEYFDRTPLFTPSESRSADQSFLKAPAASIRAQSF